MARRRSRQTLRIINWLIDNAQPATARQIADATGVHICAVYSALRTNADVFVPRQIERINGRQSTPCLMWTAWED